MENIIINNLNLVFGKDTYSLLHPVLQKGFLKITVAGSSVRNFLHDQCGIENQYIDERITTRLLDFKPVDNIDTAHLPEGSTLALSGSMPGLVGAVLRAGSFYSSFRESISHTGDTSFNKNTKCFVKVKLFNVILKELGPLFLKKGIIITNQELWELVNSEDNIFLKNDGTISKNSFFKSIRKIFGTVMYCIEVLQEYFSMDSKEFDANDFTIG